MREANAAAIACADHGEGGGARPDRGRALPMVPLFGWDVETAAPREVLSLRRLASAARAGSERSSESSSSSGDSSGDGGGEDDEVAGGSGGADGGADGGGGGGGGLLAVVQAHIAELASAKLEAMQASAEIACALMGADGILVDAR